MMHKLIVKVALCLFVFGLCLYHSIHQQNQLTRLRMQIPVLAKELKAIHQMSARLRYEIDAFESPQHLLELSRHDAYAHLKHPFEGEVLAVMAGPTLQAQEMKESPMTSNSHLQLATGAHR